MAAQFTRPFDVRKGIEHLEAAVSADKEFRYADAISEYDKGLHFLISAAEAEKNSGNRGQLKRRAMEHLARRKELNKLVNEQQEILRASSGRGGTGSANGRRGEDGKEAAKASAGAAAGSGWLSWIGLGSFSSDSGGEGGSGGGKVAATGGRTGTGVRGRRGAPGGGGGGGGGSGGGGGGSGRQRNTTSNDKNRRKKSSDSKNNSGSNSNSNLGRIPKSALPAPRRNVPRAQDLNKFEQQLIRDIVLDGPGVEWSDIAGCGLAKRTLQESVVLPMLRPDLFTGLRSPPKGVLLFGPP